MRIRPGKKLRKNRYPKIIWAAASDEELKILFREWGDGDANESESPEDFEADDEEFEDFEGESSDFAAEY